jgi:hypothetical protein
VFSYLIDIDLLSPLLAEDELDIIPFAKQGSVFSYIQDFLIAPVFGS